MEFFLHSCGCLFIWQIFSFSHGTGIFYRGGGVYMWLKLVRQTGICLILVLALALAGEVDHPQLNRGSRAVLAQLNKDYTVEDAKTFTKKITNVPVSLTKSVLSKAETPQYGKPIDRTAKGETAMVYAVEDGRVAAAGENQKIGKFIKLVHGEYSESVYGNCEKFYVKELEEVKKGQIIAAFKNDGKTEFYYSLSKLK